VTFPGPKDGGGEPGPVAPVIGKLRKQRRLAQLEIRRRKRVLVPIGAAASGPIESATATKVVLQSDFVNIVGSSAGTEIEIVRDADGRMRFYLP